MLDGSARFVRPSEDRGGALDVATGEQRAHACRRVRRGVGRHAHAVGGRDEPDSDRLEPELGAHALQQRHVAVATVPEVEVGSDDDEARVQHTCEQLFDELFGRFLAARVVERQHQTFIDRARGLEQLDLLLQRGQQARCRLGSHDLGRMTVEREHGGAEAARPREVVYQAEHRLMAQVHAVERPDRDRTLALTRRRADDLGRIAIDPHDAAPVASTTAGFTPPPLRS